MRAFFQFAKEELTKLFNALLRNDYPGLYDIRMERVDDANVDNPDPWDMGPFPEEEYERRMNELIKERRMQFALSYYNLHGKRWRLLKDCNPQKQVLVHSDQGSQYTSYEWQSFLKSHGLEGSMSRRGNCHDNAVAESFFQLLKRERIKKKIYGTREEARGDIFDYIEMFYNSKRRHGSSDQMSPTEYENQYYQRLRSV